MKISYAFAALLLSSSVNGLSIGTSLASCQNIASQFRNTCSSAPSTPASWSSFTGATVTCTQPTCPDGAPGPSCTWTRKLCVSCSQVGQQVYIRVQTNGLPDHCYGAPVAVSSHTVDFQVLFNPNSGVNPLDTFAN